jgi:hypothetical protein
MYRGQLYDECAKNRSIWLFELGEQHGKSRMYGGPIAIQAVFALPYPLKSSKATQEKLRGKAVTAFPSIGDLIRLFGELSSGILFNTDVIIVTADIQKIFCDDPYTEFTITEVAREKVQK